MQTIIQQWYLGHEADLGDHTLYLEGDTCSCCGVTFSGVWEKSIRREQ